MSGVNCHLLLSHQPGQPAQLPVMAFLRRHERIWGAPRLNSLCASVQHLHAASSQWLFSCNVAVASLGFIRDHRRVHLAPRSTGLFLLR